MVGNLSISCIKLWFHAGDTQVSNHRACQLSRNISKFLPHALHIVSWLLGKSHDFQTFFWFYRIYKPFARAKVRMLREQELRNFQHPPRYGLKIHAGAWIWFFEPLNTNIRWTCSSNLKFSKKIQVNRINSLNILKCHEKLPNFSIELGVLCKVRTKNLEAKIKKIIKG